MHKLKKKKGKKTVTHHFHHVKEKDGSKKHVYLGTSKKKAEERLTKLQLERMRSDDKLFKDIEKVQTKLNKLGHHNRHYDDVVRDIRMRHSKQTQVSKLLSKEIKTAFPFAGYLLTFLIIVFLGAGWIFLNSTPSITGASVINATATTTINNIIAGSFGMLAFIIIVSLVLHYSDYRHHHRHDKYKPQN
ncbi:hypothetical protein KY349_03780 [Candidatus Woesearchaeota archaeon]|jgi:hypothetical protein|nr:hypothetical protein [Candidatus Woesearchaeota archaeon]